MNRLYANRPVELKKTYITVVKNKFPDPHIVDMMGLIPLKMSTQRLHVRQGLIRIEHKTLLERMQT